jgi:hypothetical protein
VTLNCGSDFVVRPVLVLAAPLQRESVAVAVRSSPVDNKDAALVLRTTKPGGGAIAFTVSAIVRRCCVSRRHRSCVLVVVVVVFAVLVFTVVVFAVLVFVVLVFVSMCSDKRCGFRVALDSLLLRRGRLF